MNSDQQRGNNTAQQAHDPGKKIDYSKMNTGERDAALAREQQIKGDM